MARRRGVVLDWGSWFRDGLGSRAGKHRGVVLDGTDGARVVWPVANGGLEDDALVIPFALALGFDAVAANWSLFAALDAALAACEAAGLCSFSHFVRICWGR